MNSSIGGLSPEHYQKYLNVPSDHQVKESVRSWTSYFDLSRYSTFTLVISRVFYYITHWFKEYPNNLYLFDKFKSHQFKAISTRDEYERVREIFGRFQKCVESDKKELQRIDLELNEVEKRLEQGNEDSDSTEAENERSLGSNQREIKKVSLMEEQEEILNQGFPLGPEETLEDLFSRERGQEQATWRDYRENLRELLAVEKRCLQQHWQVENPKFNHYLQQANQAFQVLWEDAYEEVESLHKEFKYHFRDTQQPPVEILESGEVVCTSKQLDWVIDKISTRFPWLYHLAFDALSMGIYQKQQLARLAQLIFGGEAAREKSPPSPFFVRIHETAGRSTPEMTNPAEHPLAQMGSAIYEEFDGQKKANMNAEELKNYLLTYVKQMNLDPMIHGMRNRTESLYDYDLNISKDDRNPVLMCTSGESYAVEAQMDSNQLKIGVVIDFVDPLTHQVIAQGQSSLGIACSNNLSEKPQVSAIEMEDLRFGLDASSKIHRDFLVAQLLPERLMSDINALEKEVADLELIKGARSYQETKKTDENNPDRRKRYMNDLFRGGGGYLRLDRVVNKLRTLMAYMSTMQVLRSHQQLTEEQCEQFIACVEKIKNHIYTPLDMIQEISQAREENTVYQELKRKAHEKDSAESNMFNQWNILFEGSKICQRLIRVQLPSHEAPEDSHKKESGNLSSSLIGSWQFVSDAQKIIWQLDGPGGPEETFGRYLLNNTLGYLIEESSDPKYITWKIERFEKIIQGLQKGILACLEENSLSANGLIVQSRSTRAPEWMIQLAPIVELCFTELTPSKTSHPDIDQERLCQSYLQALRRFYNEKFLVRLRQAATWAKNHPDQEQEGVKHINAICHTFYTTLDLNLTCLKICEDFINLGKEVLKNEEQKKDEAELEDPLYNLIRNLSIIDQLIRAAPNGAKAPLVKQWLNSFIGHVNGIPGVADFDPNRQSNPVHVFFHKVIEKGGRDPRYVADHAMGSPTIERGNSQAEITPEFLGYLRHCQAQNPKLTHLYVNNQNFIPKKTIEGDESVRCKALHDLAEKFKDTLCVITLSQNSDFYKQTGEDYEPMADEFIKKLIAQVFDVDRRQTTGNYIPKDLQERYQLRQWGLEAANQIRNTMFNGKDRLSREENRVFIRLFYHHLVQKILIEGKFDSYNISCKDRIDRGAASDAEGYAYQAIIDDVMNRPEVIKFFEMLVFARAIIVRKRTIIRERLERLIETVKFMLDHQEQLKQLQGQLFPNVKITINQFEKIKGVS